MEGQEQSDDMLELSRFSVVGVEIRYTMYVCIYVCLYICVDICMHAYIYVYMHIERDRT